MDWDPEFLDRSPLLAPLHAHARLLRTYREWPRRADLQRLFDEHGVETMAGTPLRLAAPLAASPKYEERIFLHGELAYREGDWHDLFNALAWLAYPRTKAALNAAHHAAAQREADGAGGSKHSRGRRRDALTLLDESGAIVLSSDHELLADLRGMRWRRLFVERRERVQRSMRFFVFGHALFEKALQPYIGLTAHALLLGVEADWLESAEGARVDAVAAAHLDTVTEPQALSPLPVLGVPGWWPANEKAAFYDDEGYFRPRRLRPPSGSRGPLRP